ncbi:hypothetical protein LAZ67_2003514 [Cordylochernes scorpioides]|uniref:Reverse transcriptase/retrotransposon-derived protein RNase H-like domain-containing protein n=1 Tax=Cordylochernes scorpioides TaxID=51811 RepID=A0ABY6K5V0_9ARAC|nr:hypothetical protein LAZ67_2003514 [Cordylochernes scorpioides]
MEPPRTFSSTKSAQERPPCQGRTPSSIMDKTPPYPYRYCDIQHCSPLLLAPHVRHTDPVFKSMFVWVFGHGLDDDALAILASAKTRIYRHFLGAELRSVQEDSLLPTFDISHGEDDEAGNEYFADALTNMQHHCEDLISRLKDAMRGLAAPRTEEVIIAPIHISCAASIFLHQLEQADKTHREILALPRQPTSTIELRRPMRESHHAPTTTTAQHIPHRFYYRPVKVDRITEDSNMQRMTEAGDEYFADALTNMQPHCEDLVSRLTDAIRGIAVPRVEEALISPFDGSYAASNFIQQLERTSEGPQDDATLQTRLRTLLKVEALTEGLQASDQRLMRAIAPKTLTEWYSTMTRIKGTSSLPTPSEPFQGVSNTSAFHRDTGTPSRGRNYNPFSTNNTPRYPYGARRQPSPCKYCQGDHWNNECSMNRRPYRQQAYHGQPTAHYFPPEQNGAHNLPVPAPMSSRTPQGNENSSFQCQHSFDTLKECLTTKPVLHLFKEGLPCQLFCDASLQGIAGILKQQHPDGTLHPVQYYSRALRPHEKNYTITELECLAVIDSVEKFRIYLAGVRSRAESKMEIEDFLLFYMVDEVDLGTTDVGSRCARWTKSRGPIVIGVIWVSAISLSSVQLVYSGTQAMQWGDDVIYDCKELMDEDAQKNGVRKWTRSPVVAPWKLKRYGLARTKPIKLVARAWRIKIQESKDDQIEA